MANNVSSEAVAAALAGAWLLLAPAVAEDRPIASVMPPAIGVTERVVADRRSGFGLAGFDPVTYFLGGAPQPGAPGRELIWNGVAWRFLSDANRDAFRRDPQVYAPRLGGHDPAAMAQGRLAAAEPTHFAVAGERLYLFQHEASRRRFLAEPGLAGEAEIRWRELQAGLVRD